MKSITGAILMLAAITTFSHGSSFEEAGGETFTYIPCLNDDDAHIRALSDIIEQNLGGWIS